MKTLSKFEGDARDALVEASRVHLGALRAVAMNVIGDRSMVDDIVQEALANALSARSGAAVDNPKAYLLVSVRNVALRYAKRDAAVVCSVEDYDDWDFADHEPLPDRVVEARERMRVLEGAVEALPDQCRNVFVLKKFRGLSQAQISQELRIAESTVEKHLIKAMKRCRAQLSAYDTGEGAAYCTGS